MTNGERGASIPRSPRGGRAPNPRLPGQSSLGPAVALTPEQVDHFAGVTTVDVVAARALWRDHAPAKLRDLLDAIPDKGD